MSNIKKKPYEISLWDDILVFRVAYYNSNGEEIRVKEYLGSLANFEEIEGTTTRVTQYYKERKICVIGSDTMDSSIRATSGKLVSNINGSNTLTFSIQSHYYDEETKELIKNPFLKFLVNERKVKLRHGSLADKDCKWYDFIIKDIQANSENKTLVFTCQDLFINELSKSGFNIQLDPKLENNMGNIVRLAEYVLDESDWQVGENNDVIQQTKEEALYQIKLNRDLTAKDMQGPSQEELSLSEGDKIYAFYSIISNEESYFQFLYCKDGKYETDTDRVITNSPNYYIDNIAYTEEGLPDFAEEMILSSEYRGDKLVRQPITEFDATINKYVNVFKKGEDGQTYYGFTQTDYITPTAVQTYITNGEGFTSVNGWKVGGYREGESATETIYPSLELIGFPDSRDVEDLINIEEYRSFLKFNRANEKQLLYNSGFEDHRSTIKTLAVGEKFIIRAKISEVETINDNNRPEKMKSADGNEIHFVIAEYTLENGVYTLGEEYFSGSFVKKDEKEGWLYGTPVESLVSKSYSDLISKRIGIFFKTELNKDFYFENIQFYRYVEYDRLKGDSETEYETVIAEPGGELFSSARTRYIYYEKNSAYKTLDDVIPVYDSYIDDPSFEKQYNENQFEKVRSITVTESNRFNIIQELCEIFECWAKFKIEHNQQTGEILLDDNYRQKKWVTFHNYIGKSNYAGFKYGINLKSIQRTLNSDEIVSKIIVKDNANEFAPNGFCSIARAIENPTGENSLYNFNYYIQQGLVDFQEINNDLYSDVNGYLGYYKNLKKLNSDREEEISKYAQLSTDISQYEANYQTYKLSVEQAEEELRDTELYIENMTGLTLAELREDKENTWWNEDSLLAQANKVSYLRSLIKQHSALRDIEQVFDENSNPIDGRLYRARQDYEAISQYIKDLAAQKRELNLQFYKKYSRFIQEGSWISEDYVDENLYYMDAESTLFTSAQPKVSYAINVLELSQLEGYENYQFDLGDKTYVEDTEFFGWVWSNNGVRTPYQEEVVISESTIELDSPENNTFKVQNFKTQFADLFQRIAATTQNIEFHSGEYGRAASIVEQDGTISAETLQNSLANNTIRLENARDQSVIWDETGITTISLSNPSEIVRIVSGGIFMSIDGGNTWNTGISGSGINANYLTTGQINTSSVNIMNGSFPSFRWDSKGITAFEFGNVNNEISGFNTSKFVRYDQYGLYGINGHSNFDAAVEEDGKVGEEKIWDNANFALTWKGFLLRNDEGSVKITSNNDIQVIKGEQERIKIGRLGNDAYGLRIRDDGGKVVIENSSDGKVWIKNELKIGGEKSTVSLGFLGNNKATIYEGNEDFSKIEPENIHEIINANNKFIVYEDGSMKATEGEFQGKVIATSGQFGSIHMAQNGLQIYNADFEIMDGPDQTDENGNPILAKRLLAFSSETNQLTLEGAVFATSGSFTGVIHATEADFDWGRIGGFKIENEGYFKTYDSSFITSKTYYIHGENDVFVEINETDKINGMEEGVTYYEKFNTNRLVSIGGGAKPNVILDGSDGNIYANKITLGTGATIENYLQLGTAKIYNPQVNGGIFIESGNKGIVINQDGTASFGKIKIFGQESAIRGDNWTITNDKAVFNNVVVNGEIETAVFKTNSTQAAGGTIIYRPSYKIEEINKNELTLSENPPDLSNHSVWLVKNNEYVKAVVNKVEENKVELNTEVGNDYIALIDVGEEEDLLIGMNSGSNTVGENHILPRGLTITKYGTDKPNLFLGDLEVLNDLFNTTNYSGYGLYSDNVYLRGSLTTFSSSQKVAGVNTASEVISLEEKVGENSPIIFWAGANSSNAEDIQKAPFQVTENGSMYASNANFANSIFAGGTITGADIYTARLHGGTKGEAAALTIYDTKLGICFRHSFGNESDTDALLINVNGFQKNNQTFIDFSNNSISVIGDIIKTKDKNNYLSLKTLNGIPVLYHNQSNIQGCGFYFENDKTTFKMSVETIENSGVQNEDEILSLHGSGATFYKTVQFGENKMQYKPVSNGYDLYVFE